MKELTLIKTLRRTTTTVLRTKVNDVRPVRFCPYGPYINDRTFPYYVLTFRLREQTCEPTHYCLRTTTKNQKRTTQNTNHEKVVMSLILKQVKWHRAGRETTNHTSSIMRARTITNKQPVVQPCPNDEQNPSKLMP